MKPDKRSYRPEIDGLRAFAVLSIVVFHAFPNSLPGGFIGVDIFFVISGYLITGNIYENLEKKIFKFSDFFGRRIKRIFPSLILVLLISLLIGWLTFISDEFFQFGKHIKSSAFFFLNFVLVGESGYFDNESITKPLLHLWSLAVEEQFYILWPIVLWFTWKCKSNLTIIITILILIFSFYLNIKFTSSNPIQAYYLPFSRFWELLCGSALAWISIYKKNLISFIKIFFDKYYLLLINSISLLGLMLLIFGIFQLNEKLPFPSYRALIPTLGAILIISSGPLALFNKIFFCNPVSIWFGLISYPLYLWHWPILSFIYFINGEAPKNNTIFLAIFASILFSWITYNIVEKKFIKRQSSIKISIGLLLIMIFFGFIGNLIELGKIKPYSVYLNNELSYQSRLKYDFPNKLAPIKRHSPQSLDEKKECFKKLKIPLDSKIRNCSISLNNEELPKVAVIGDSHSVAAYKGIEYYFKKDHNLLTFNIAGRLFSNVVNAPEDDTFESNVYLGGFEIADYVHEHKEISTIIMISRGFFYLDWAKNFHIPGKKIDKKEDVFIEGLKDLFNRFPDRKIIFVLETPTLNFDPRSCGNQRPIQRILSFFSKNSFIKECSIDREIDDSIHKIYIEKTTELINNYKNIVIVDPRETLCDLKKCYIEFGGRIIYSDTNHLNINGSYILGKKISEAFNLF